MNKTFKQVTYTVTHTIQNNAMFLNHRVLGIPTSASFATITIEHSETMQFVSLTLGRIKKQSCFSSPPSSLLGAASLFFFFFFYKNADNALEIELKRSKIEMPLSFLMFRHVFVQM